VLTFCYSDRMSGTSVAANVLLLLATGILPAQAPSSQKLDNQFLAITVAPGWRVADSTKPAFILRLVRDNYTLSINPIFTHASGVEGGRFSEIVAGVPSVDAVMLNVDQPAGGFECAQIPSEPTIVNNATQLGNLYTDTSKTGNGCVFPISGESVWFGSYFSGEGPESEYTVTLAYQTSDVNKLPKKGSRELASIIADSVAMLKTLKLKPPLIISRIQPDSARPCTPVTIHGSGFDLPGFRVTVRFTELPNQFLPYPNITPDGTSLTFRIPTSIQKISCPEGRVEVAEWCVPAPPNHDDASDCPRIHDVSTTFCGAPFPAATYHISVIAESTVLSTEALPFAITSPASTPVVIPLLYPNELVSPGDMITVHGTGFTSTGNAVKIGSSVVTDLSSPDGASVVFRAPSPSGTTLLAPLHIYEASVSNTNGVSNAITFWYRE